MKKIAFVLITVLLFGVGTIKAQDQLLSDSEPISSGCLKRNNRSNGDEASSLPTIKLTKEGNILSVDLLNYSSNCGTTGFDMESRMSSGNDDIPSVVISVVPVIPAEMDCYCPFNISYTVRDFEKNKFYLTCWWYEGDIELTEGEPLVLEYKTEDVIIDGLKFTLLKTSHQAKLLHQDTWDDEVLQIPSEVEYEGEKYIVTSINGIVFSSNTSIKQIIIPKTVKNRDFGRLDGITWNIFYTCLSLETIEVDEDNPAICSIDGVLFNKDKTILISYPAASPRKSYSVPDFVKTAANHAFFNSQHLKNIVLPDNMETLGTRSFTNSNKLEEVILSSSIKELPNYLFNNCKKLKSVVIPSGITSIGYGVFDSCEAMQSFNLPETINSIGGSAFGQLPNLKHMYCHSTTVPNTRYDVFYNTDLSQATLHVPAASVSAYQAAEPWKNFKEIVALTDQGDETDDSDYIPFVELGKQWHVVSNASYPYSPSRYERYDMFAEVERDGKTYVHIGLIDDGVDTEEFKDAGLFREENRRVYKYDGKAGRDVLMYDFSLKEGDTFTYEFDYGQPVNCKVLKLGWLEDGPKIALPSTTPADTLDIKYRRLRTWTIGREYGSGEYYEVVTWVEGVGTLTNMFDSYGLVGRMSCLAYIERKDAETDYHVNTYLPFSFYNMYGPTHGCNLPTGAENNEEDEWSQHHLTYELEGDRLHVYGDVFTQCGPNNYAYFIEKRTDDSKVHKIEFKIQEVTPVANCMALHATNFYVPGFDPNLNYIVVDNHGEEHPVINKTPQDEYRPFIEDGKVWVVRGYPDVPDMDTWTDYCYFAGDTIVGGQTCKQMKKIRNASEENWINGVFTPADSPQEYVGAWYEQDKKVYFANYLQDHLDLYYDFTLCSNDTIDPFGGFPLVVSKVSGGIPGFKGSYYEFWHDNQLESRWLEGVGSESWPYVNHPWMYDGAEGVLLACYVDDEVIYYNSEVEDPYSLGAKKRRFDFTHTTKIQPKTPKRRSEDPSLYGEYNDKLLGINLDPVDDAYLVRITDETGKVVYEKAINAGSIVALNIDISSYATGRYTVTVENSQETFTGEFETQATGIREVESGKRSEVRDAIYNLQGQRLSSMQKGLNIVNGKKVYVR